MKEQITSSKTAAFGSDEFKNCRLRLGRRENAPPVLKALVVRKYLHFEASVIAALFCGFTGVLKEHYLSGLSGNGIAVFLFYFLLGWLFSFILLFPLKLCLKKLNPAFAAALFLAIGFGVSAFLAHVGAIVTAHGNDPYSLENMARTYQVIFVVGLVGAVSSMAAWLYIRLQKQK